MSLRRFPASAQEGEAARAVHRTLESLAGRPVILVLTHNRTSLVSYRLRSGVVHLRLHEVFLDAGPDVLAEIGAFIVRRPVRAGVLRQFIESRQPHPRAANPRPARLHTQGIHHDLNALFCHLNETYFEGRLSAHITWGRRGAMRAARRRTLGSYSSQTNTIRINPLLDRRGVPRYVVEHVIHHEMLHAELGVVYQNGRRRLHFPEFKRRERLFKDYEKAAAWQPS